MQPSEYGYFSRDVWRAKILPHVGVRDLQAVACTSKKLNTAVQSTMQTALQQEFAHIDQVKEKYFADLNWTQLGALLQREGVVGVKAWSEGERYEFCREHRLEEVGAVVMVSAVAPFTAGVLGGLLALFCAPGALRRGLLIALILEGSLCPILLGTGIALEIESTRRAAYVKGSADYSARSLVVIQQHNLAKLGRQGRLGSQRQVNFALLAQMIIRDQGEEEADFLQPLYGDCCARG